MRVGILGVNPELHRRALDPDLALLEPQLLAHRKRQTLPHQVDPGHHLGHPVLDLDPRVHLDEIEAAVGASRNSTVPTLE